MANYIGEKCLICNETFKEGDDIVVCPDCGTPYHRECYKKVGKCINTELHEKGESFKPSVIAQSKSDGELRCPRCGAINAPLALFCEKCGMPLTPSQENERETDEKNSNQQANPGFFGNTFSTQPFFVNFSDPLCGLNPEENYEDVKLSEIADFVGTNTFYYLPLFKRIKETGHKLTWNFSAMLFPTFYFAYRKMFLFMVLSFILEFILSTPSIIMTLATGILGNSPLTEFAKSFNLTDSNFQFASNAVYFLNYVFKFLTGAFANWVYYRHVLNKIKKLKSENRADRETIKTKGGVSKLAVILIPCIMFVLSIIISMVYILFTLQSGNI